MIIRYKPDQGDRRSPQVQNAFEMSIHGLAGRQAGFLGLFMAECIVMRRRSYVLQAHGGSMIEHEGIYYWYGEKKDGLTYNTTTNG